MSGFPPCSDEKSTPIWQTSFYQWFLEYYKIEKAVNIVSMEANTTTASTTVLPAAQISQGRMTEGVQGRGEQGDSSAAFSQRTNVSIDTAIDHLADVLSKISGRQQTNVQQMPQELKEIIQNMIRQSFSIETTLGQGLGSTAASERFATDQLTTLARMLNQLGTMAEAGSSLQIGDDLAALLVGLKTALARESGGTFEPIMLTKAAFQLLDTGNAELLPQELQTFLSQLSTQGIASGGTGTSSLSLLNQLVQLLMPRNTEGAPSQIQNNEMLQGQPANEQGLQRSSADPNTNLSVPEENTSTQTNSKETIAPRENLSPTLTGKEGNTDSILLQKTSSMSTQEGLLQTQKGQNTTTGQSQSVPNTPTSSENQQTASGKDVGTSLQRQGNSATTVENTLRSGAEPNSTPTSNSSDRMQTSAPPTGDTPSLTSSGKESERMSRQGAPTVVLENNESPQTSERLSPRMESRQEAALQTAQSTRSDVGREADIANAVRSPAQTAAQMKSSEMQNVLPRFFTQTMENTPQTMNVLRNLAQTLLQNENLSQREALLLQNFVSGRSQTMSEGDAKQLQQLIQLTQQNIPGTIRQAALEQHIPDLPRLWAFMQMADIVKTRGMTAEQYKRAGRDVAALALTMRNALEGENAAPQPGQRSMNFVMPLFMGTSEYPAYIHVYDEARRDEETDRVKKETWLRICVLTDNIGTVELINRIYEENHVDMRLYFSDADAAWEFRHVLDEIRETADGTSLIIEGIQIGAIGERRFFTN